MTKFCSNCMKVRPIEGGTLIRTKNNRVRWRCAVCTQRVRDHLKSGATDES